MPPIGITDAVSIDNSDYEKEMDNGSGSKANGNLTDKINEIKVYTEGFRVPVLNRRAIGCKSLNLYPIV